MKKESDLPIEVLYVEDNPSDARLVKEAMSKSKIEYKLIVVEDGIEAMDYLKNKDKYSEVKRPDIILLDLNLPLMDGREVLKEIKLDSALKHIPVIVFTTSDSEQDVMKCYSLHANCYITKPFHLNQFMSTIHHIEDFWLLTVKLRTNKKINESSN